MAYLANACAHGSVDDVRRYLDGGADVDGTDEHDPPLYIACWHRNIDAAARSRRQPRRRELRLSTWRAGRPTDVALLLLDRGADYELANRQGMSPLYAACYYGRVDAVQLLLERGANVNQVCESGRTLPTIARERGYPTAAAWLARIQAQGGWTHHVSAPRYKLVVLRELAARRRARRQRAFYGKEHVLDFLFPGDQPTRRPRRMPRLPDELFSIILRYYWRRHVHRGGGRRRRRGGRLTTSRGGDERNENQQRGES